MKLENPLQKKSDCSAWVYTLEKNFGPLQADIRLDLTPDDPIAVAIRKKVRELPVISEQDVNFDLRVVNAGAEVQLRSGDLVLEKMNAKKSATLIAERMVRKMLALAQADYLRNLQVQNDRLKVRLEVVPVELDANYHVKRVIPLSEKQDAQGNISFNKGDAIRLRLHNEGLRTAYFTVLDIQSNNEFLILAPDNKETPEELKIEPGQSLEIPRIFGMSPSNGMELLKVLATDQPVDLSTITQTRGVDSNTQKSALAQLFAQTYFNEDCVTRGGKTTSVPVENLHIETVVFQVKE
ncbi:MAG: hypothetical protein IT261_12015 [Saprospiraceae bacterium]|nr:hypothetical protein [Saprospiraceae bacterium]